MKHLLNDEEVSKSRENLLNYYLTAEKGSDMNFDKLHFVKKENWILEQIN